MNDTRTVEAAVAAAETRGFACGRADARFKNAPDVIDWQHARKWSRDYGISTQHAVPETTGEHVWAKLQDNPYDFEAVEPEPGDNQYMRDMAKLPGLRRVPVVGWQFSRGPIRVSEYALGIGVVSFVLILFAFFVIFYKAG